MPRMMNVLLAASLVATAGGCSSGGGETAPTPSATRAAARTDAVVRYDADHTGKYIGVRTYPGPWNRDHSGSFAHGQVITALCQQEGRQVVDTDVPQGAPPVDTTTWLRFEGGQWSPKPYYDLGGAALAQCADVGLAVPSPAVS
jgi:hypothetical protein